MKIRLMRWTGGKYRVMHLLTVLFPETEVYCEPFLGSGAVLLNQHRHETEIVNDFNPNIYTLHKVVADRNGMEELSRRLLQTAPTEEVFKYAREMLDDETGLDDITRAWCQYVVTTLSFNAMGRHFAKGSHEAKSFHENVRFYLPKVWERYQGVEFQNRDGIVLMGEVKNNPDAFVFADPPYLPELRGNKAIYEQEFGTDQHIRLLEMIRDAKCKMMLCGYARDDGKDLYDEKLFPYGWRRYLLTELVQSCMSGSQKKLGSEYIWVNYELPESAKYFINMSTMRAA